ncbi:FAD-dependent monooxygenase [Halomonas sp. HAL1]|uniref:FAD-dependent monooxygenase n=1 Tax=Halomonas sp. HAL1 TaxID=550984 RepID=UPI00022D3034|nr:FAD-dependent monooxygenase [Halomonas sp. HAL1]EHA13633.1 phenol 2-monooxygenase [Halomonas sp. HAL1]WKV91611.1 FAD-dependent monooxygenase [Halomonas sp. HAL1]
MQYFLDGYRSGDPRIQPAAEGRSDPQGPLPEEVDVLIVGTGPAGLLLASQLSAFPDIVTRVVEKSDGALEVGRADGIACRTVEMFEAFGLAEKLTTEAYWINETHFWGPALGNKSRITRLGRVQDVRDGLSEFPHVIVNQARLLDFLLEYMHNSSSRLRVDYSHETLNVEVPMDPHERVMVTLSTPKGEKTVRAQYVVGCDGAHSVVRESIGRFPQGHGVDKAWGVMDVLAVTDFPDIRFKCTIQSAESGNILLIPREGGYMVRLYVDMGNIAPDVWLTEEEVLDKAQAVLSPYTFEVKETAWFSVYRVGHRVTDKFDDVDDDQKGSRTPRVFIAGDACHTHSAKAGQGMNVSMQDTFNLGWKLISVLKERSPASLLHTYNDERHVIAENLIEMDTRWSCAIGAAQDSDDPEAAMKGLAEVQRQFVTNSEFTAGFATHYTPGLLTGGDSHLHLATGFPPGRRFHSAEVIRLGDAKQVHLGHVHRADGRWRLYAFADMVDPRSPGSRFNTLMDYLASDASVIRRFTPKGADLDAIFDVHGIIQQSHLEVDWADMHSLLKPNKGLYGLQDYQKSHAPVLDSDCDIFDLRGIDRGAGALVVVRPDQYVSLVLPLDSFEELNQFFARFMVEPV